MSLGNWDGAVRNALIALDRERDQYNLMWGDPIPDGRFLHATSLPRRATAHYGNQRKLIFNIQGEQTEPGLLYHEANVTLTGLLKYQQEWKSPPNGNSRDQVRMPRFELWMNDDTVEVAKGTVDLFIPCGSLDSLVLTSRSTSPDESSVGECLT